MWYYIKLPTLVDLQSNKQINKKTKPKIFVHTQQNEEYNCYWGRPCGVMAKVLLEVSRFELQSCYEIHFRTYTFKKGMNPLILLAKLNSIIIFSGSMSLVLNNPLKVICHLKKMLLLRCRTLTTTPR